MPTYDYCCDGCGYHWEVMKLIAERDNEELCPECGIPGRRLISGGGHIAFHGIGFYATDYSGKPHENPKKSYGRGSGKITQQSGMMHPDDPVPKKGGG